MSKRPYCLDFDDGSPLKTKKARVARILLVPTRSFQALSAPHLRAHLSASEAAALEEYGSLLPWLTAADAKRRRVTDAFVDVLSSSAQHLHEVSLSFNPDITDSSLMLLGFRCPQLRQLEVQGCPCVTSQGLEGVLRSSKEALEMLDVRGCPLVDDRSVPALVACRNLRELLVSGAGFTSEGLRVIASSLSQLEVIDLAGVALSSSDFRCLVLALPRLRKVDVSFCSGLKPEDVQCLFDANPCMTVKAFGIDLFGVRVPDTATLVY